MIVRFIRVLISSTIIYLFFRVGYPEPGHSVYHTLAPLGILGGAAIMAFALRLVEAFSDRAPLLLEALFAAVVVVALGFTMPAKKEPPLARLLRGEVPTQSAVKDGLDQLGIDPKSDAARKVIGIFPR